MIRFAPALLLACNPAPDDTGEPTPHGAIVTTTDFAVGALATVDLDSFAVTDNVGTSSADPFVQFEDANVWQVNGADAVIAVYEPGDFGAPDRELTVNPTSGPREVARVGDKLFVTLYEADHIAVIDPENNASLGEVDLSDWAGTDGVPEASTMVEIGTDLFVALERLNRDDDWSDDSGHVIRVDTESFDVTGSWEVGPSPKIYPHPTESEKLIVRTGLFAQAVGGIRTLDPAQTDPGPMLLDAATLGYGISEWAAAPSGRAIVIGEHTDYTYTVECYDPEQGVANILPPTGDWLANPDIDDQGRVWIPVRSFTGASGLMVIDAETCAVLTDELIGTTLPPYRVAFY